MDKIELAQRREWARKNEEWVMNGEVGSRPVKPWLVNSSQSVSSPPPVIATLLASTLVPTSTASSGNNTSILPDVTKPSGLTDKIETGSTWSGYASVPSTSTVRERREVMPDLTPNPLADLIDLVKEQIGQLGKTPLEAFCEKTGKAFDVELKEKAVDEGMEVVIREDRKEEIGTAFNLFYSTLINLISDGFSFKFNGQEISDYDTIRNMLMNTMEPISEQDPRSKSFVMLDNCLSLLVPLIKSKLLHQPLSEVYLSCIPL